MNYPVGIRRCISTIMLIILAFTRFGGLPRAWAATPGRAWTPVETLGWSQGPVIASPRFELGSQGTPFLFARAWGGGSSYDCLGFVWNGTAWIRTWQVGRGLNFSWPVWAPPGEFYIIGQDPTHDAQNMSWFWLAHKVGDGFEVENVTRANTYCTDYSAAVSNSRRWVFLCEQGTSVLRLLCSDQIGDWNEIPISGTGGAGLCIAALDDTTAIMLWGSDSGLHWATLSGTSWAVGSSTLADGLAGNPVVRLRPSGGYWTGYATQRSYVCVRAYQDAAWGDPQVLQGDFRTPFRPDHLLSAGFEMSRDPGEYPAIGWGAYNSLRGRDCILVSVPTDEGWTVSDELQNDDDGILPTVARDPNGDVWVAFWRYSMNGVFWTHTYTRATSSTPVVYSQGTTQLVTWTLSEPAPETWWVVLREIADGGYEAVARVRAGSSTDMSWRGTSPPSGTLHYRIRRECLDTRFQWLSDWSDVPVPAVATLVSAKVTTGEVRLTWYCKEQCGAGVVSRRAGDGQWIDLGPAQDQGDGILTYLDADVAPGRYAYRLGLGAGFTSETWVDVPGFTLGLGGFRPNPTVGALRVAISLASDAPAILELFAVNGRRVAREDVGALGPGAHMVELERRSAVRPGVYWIRLTQAGTSVSAKGVVTH